MKDEGWSPAPAEDNRKTLKDLVRLEFYNSSSAKKIPSYLRGTLIVETRQDFLYSSVPVIKPWQGRIYVCHYESRSLPPCQCTHSERNVQKLPQRYTALDLQQNSCIVNTCLDLQGNSWCQRQFCAQYGQYMAPKENFRSWECIEINQHLLPHWRKTNEQGLWI